jgi:hypothetical protein
VDIGITFIGSTPESSPAAPDEPETRFSRGSPSRTSHARKGSWAGFKPLGHSRNRSSEGMFPEKKPGLLGSFSSNFSLLGNMRPNMFTHSKSVDPLLDEGAEDIHYQLEKAKKMNELLKKQVKTLQKESRDLKVHCETLNEQLLKSKMKRKGMKQRYRDQEQRLKSLQQTLAENAQEFADYQIEMDEKVRRFQREKINERKQRLAIKKEFETLGKDHSKLRRKYDKLKSSHNVSSPTLSPETLRPDTPDVSITFNLLGDDMKRLNVDVLNQRSSFSSMPEKSQWTVPQLLRTVERLKNVHYQNFIEQITDEDYTADGDIADDDVSYSDGEIDRLTKRASKVLFSTLIESYSVIVSMYDSAVDDLESYARMLCALTPNTLRDRVFESMEMVFPEEFSVWFELATEGDLNRNSFKKFITKCLNVSNGMVYFGQLKDDVVNLGFFPSTTDGVESMDKELNIFDYGRVMNREDLFDPTPKSDVWRWHCSFPAVVDHGSTEHMEDASIMKAIRERDTDKFRIFRSRMFVFKSE